MYVYLLNLAVKDRRSGRVENYAITGKQVSTVVFLCLLYHEQTYFSMLHRNCVYGKY